MIKTHQQLPKEWDEREKLRNKGQFWTPSWVAEAMVAYVIENTELIFDPAAGKGAFCDALRKIDKSNKVEFYGIDISSEVLRDGIYNNNCCRVELRDFIKNPPNKKFKAIVANPPYIRHHRIDEETKKYIKQLCGEITGFTIDGRAGYHIFFLLQALNSLEDKGRLAFIMPADTCEGTFANNLWNWITENYCLECVVTFAADATPFPNVDTNAVVFFIKKDKPKKEIYWVKAFKAYSNDLYNFISCNFKEAKYETLHIVKRNLREALKTGLSRPVQDHVDYKHHLYDFATVMRGVATGANEFFFLTKQLAEELNLPKKYLKIAIGRTRDVNGNILTKKNVEELEKKPRPTLLLSIDREEGEFTEHLLAYLKRGAELGLPNRSLIKQRKPWYKMEKREVPELLFAYLGRRNARFIKNEAGAIPLTGFLCVYPVYKDKEFVNNLLEVLNHPDVLKNLKFVGKSYGSGAIKVEPRNLERLPIPDYLVEQYNLKRQYKTRNGQLILFREKKEKYGGQIKHRP